VRAFESDLVLAFENDLVLAFEENDLMLAFEENDLVLAFEENDLGAGLWLVVKAADHLIRQFGKCKAVLRRNGQIKLDISHDWDLQRFLLDMVWLGKVSLVKSC